MEQKDPPHRREFLPRGCVRLQYRAANFRVLAEAAFEELANAWRNMPGEGIEARLFQDHGGQNFRSGFAGKNRLTGEQFVQYSAEGPDVRAAVDGLAFGLLGRHVSSCSK